MPVLAVGPKGGVTKEGLDAYIRARREAVGERLGRSLENRVVRGWLEALVPEDLSEEKDGEKKYLGDASGEAETKAALEKARATDNPVEMVAFIEELILCFCGFSVMRPCKAMCIVNAVHFQFGVNVERLLSAELSLPAADGTPTDAEKALFDESTVELAELLLRCVVENDKGDLVASPFSPGMPMSKLLKLPLFAQYVMVLTNAVEAVWYQEAIPTCPMAINLYASLLVADAPVEEMTAGVKCVEVMEMSKGAKRGPEVDQWVEKIRENAIVMLDDFDAKHPGLNSKPSGIKVSVFVNAFHTLQAYKNEASVLPIADVPVVDKEGANPMNFLDYYGTIVPKHQTGVQYLVMEGSENCMKAEVTPGPPLNFGEPKATTASAHVYQVAARSLSARQPEGQVLRMLHQGGRALYADEDFDEDVSAVIAATGKAMPAARAGDAGTMAWMGDEATRRASMKSRLPVCGVKKKA